MKAFNLTIIPLILIHSALARAEFAWARTAFWQAPYETNQTLHIEAVDPNLAQVCQEYKDVVVSASGTASLEATDIQMLRTLSTNVTRTQFSAKFRIAKVQSQNLIKTSIDSANQAASLLSLSNPLPDFLQFTTEILPSGLPVGAVSVVTKNGSLSNISKSVGLPTLNIKVLGNDWSTTVELEGKDLACDLLNGAANLQFESSATVRISFDAQRRIDDFYRQVERASGEALTQKSSARGRAALLGFKLAPAFASRNIGKDLSKTVMKNIIEQFFDLKMNRNSSWSSSKHLNVDGGVSAPLHLTLEK
jgi:hypothetical protein